MNSIFNDVIDIFMVIYLDDLLIYSDSYEEHINHLEIVLSRLQDHELYVGKSKFELFTQKTEFLGLDLGVDGISVGDERKRIVREWPRPSNLTELRGFIGLLQFFRRFIKDFSHIAAPLTNLTRKGSGIHRWDDECTLAFKSLKDLLCTSPIMQPPNWDLPFRCHIDASELAVGGTLTQLDEQGHDHAVAYFSKRLSTAEENYSANDRELLGLVYFLKRFRCYLEGSEFEVVTDNQVLKHFFSKQDLSRREARWLEFLSHFGITELTLERGKVHILGDTLSRAPHAPQLDDLEVNNIHTFSFGMSAQYSTHIENDPTFGPVWKALNGTFPDDKIQRGRINRLLPSFKLDQGKLIYDNKICIPRCQVKEILSMAHDSRSSGHFAYNKTLSRLSRVHWRNKTRDVQAYCAGCVTCQQFKDNRVKPLGEPQPIPLPERRWGSVAMDFITHLPVTPRGFNSITTIVDRFSRRVHFMPSKDTDTALDTARSFFNEVFRLHGLPDSIISDRDPKFTSAFWEHLMKMCDIKLRRSSSHHPQTDGSSEIMNRLVEKYLRCYCSLNQHDWDSLLPTAEFAFNSSRLEATGYTPFELDLGWNPSSPLDMLTSAPSDTVQSVDVLRKTLQSSLIDARFSHEMAQARQSANNAQNYRPHSYRPGDFVWLNKKYFTDIVYRSQLSKKLGARRFGPFRILELVGKNAVRLDLPTSIRAHNVVHVEHTKPHVTQPPDISTERTPKAQLHFDEHGDQVIEIGAILGHKRKSNTFYFLALPANSPTHDASWQPLKDFVDDDGTITAALHCYIVRNGILPHLH